MDGSNDHCNISSNNDNSVSPNEMSIVEGRGEERRYRGEAVIFCFSHHRY